MFMLTQEMPKITISVLGLEISEMPGSLSYMQFSVHL